MDKKFLRTLMLTVGLCGSVGIMSEQGIWAQTPPPYTPPACPTGYTKLIGTNPFFTSQNAAEQNCLFNFSMYATVCRPKNTPTPCTCSTAMGYSGLMSGWAFSICAPSSSSASFSSSTASKKMRSSPHK